MYQRFHSRKVEMSMGYILGRPQKGLVKTAAGGELNHDEITPS